MALKRITKADPNMECPRTSNYNLGDDRGPIYGDDIDSGLGNEVGDTNTKMLAFVDINGKQDNSITFESPTWMTGVFIKYMANPNVICHKYLYNGATWDDVTANYSSICYSDTLALSGAFMVKGEILWMRVVGTLPTRPTSYYSEYAKTYSDITAYIKHFTDAQQGDVTSRLNLDDYILLINPLANQPNYSNAQTEHMWDTTAYPFVETKSTSTTDARTYHSRWRICAASCSRAISGGMASNGRRPRASSNCTL